MDGNKFITIEAPETMNLKCKNLNIEVEENITTHAGRDIKTTAQNEIIQDSTGKTQIHSSNTIELEAQNTLDMYGKKKLITYTQGNAEIGALGQTHVHGANSRITALNKIDYKAPDMGQLFEPGEFLYGKEKEITDIIVMDKNFEENLEKNSFKEKVNLLVYTRNYEEGEEVTVIWKDESGEEQPFIGIVDKDGIATIEKVLFNKNEIQEEPEEPLNTEKDEEYRTYKGKKYNQEEWEKKEQKLWEQYQAKKNRKGFLDFF
jgi:hypothetical protein